MSTSPSPSARHRPLARLCLGAGLVVALGHAATAQVVYSVDFRSIDVNQLDGSGTVQVITPGTLLTPPGGTPQVPSPTVNFRALVLVGGGVQATGAAQAALGVLSHDDCSGTPAGIRCGYDVDALSFGRDDVVDPGLAKLFEGDGGIQGAPPPPTSWSEFLFSIDDHSGGVAGVGIEPNPESETRIVAGVRAGDAAADVFATLDLPTPPLDASVSGPGATGW